MYNDTYGVADIVASYYVPSPFFIDTSNGGINDIAVELKLRHLVLQGGYWTCFGVYCSTMSDDFSLNSILMGHNNRANKVGLLKGQWLGRW